MLRLAMRIETPRFLLRDFGQADLAAFLAYQGDPRYRRLYDLDEADAQRAIDLFDLFRSWQREEPRRNRQLGIFERRDGRLCGCAGLRRIDPEERRAELGIELNPDDWGRYRLAIEVAGALVAYGFRDLGFLAIVGSTASGNRRVERLARWFGAEIIARRTGPEWMAARDWVEVDWILSRDRWEQSKWSRDPWLSRTHGRRTSSCASATG
jgi:[ribosomal protein S5]-alanine N-acetyltransferase